MEGPRRPQRRHKRALEIMRIVIYETVKVLYVVEQVMEAQIQKMQPSEQSLQESWQKLLQKLHFKINCFYESTRRNLKNYEGEFQAVNEVLNKIHTIPPLPIKTTDIQMQCYLLFYSSTSIKEVQENAHDIQKQIQTRLRQCVKQLTEIVPPELVLLVEQQKGNEVVDPFLNNVQSLHTKMQTEMQEIQQKLQEIQIQLEQQKIEQEEPQTTHTKCINEYIQWIQEQTKVVQRQAKMAERRQWDEYYMKIACLAAQRSKDPSTPVS